MKRPRSPRSRLLPVLLVVAVGVAVIAFALGWRDEKLASERIRRLESDAADAARAHEAMRAEQARLAELSGSQRADVNRLERELETTRDQLGRATKRAEEATAEKDRLTLSLDLLREATDKKLTDEAERVQKRIEQLQGDIAALEKARAAWGVEKQRLEERIERVKSATASEAQAAIALSDDLVRSVRRVLVSMGSTTPEEGRELVARRLGKIGVLLPVLEKLTSDDEVAPWALRSLAVVGGNSAERFLRLVEGGVSETPDARLAAGSTLVALTAKAELPNHPRLDELSRHTSPAVRRVVIEAMRTAKYRDDDRQVARRLAGFLGDEDATVDAAAFAALTSRRFMPFAFEDFARRVMEPANTSRDRWLTALMVFDTRATLQVIGEKAGQDAWLEEAVLQRLEAFDRGLSQDLVAEVIPFVRPTGDDRGARWVKLVRGADPQTDSPEDPLALRRWLVNQSAYQEPLLRALTAPHTIDPFAVRRSNEVALSTDQVGALAHYVQSNQAAVGLTPREWEKSLATVCFREDVRLASVALSAMVQRPSTRMVPVLVRMLDKVDVPLGVELAAALAKMGHQKGEEYLARLIVDDRAWRRTAIDKLVEADTPQAVKAAEVVFETKDPDGAWRLVEMLWPTDHVLSFERVEQLVTTDLLDFHRADIIYDYLDKVHKETIRAHVAEWLLADRVVVLGPTIDFIAFPADEKIGSLLRRFVSHTDPRAREAALRGLRFHDVGDMVGDLSRMVRDDDTLVRVQLAHLLGTTDDPVARGSLIVLTKDAEWLVREAAALALRSHRGAPLIPALRSCARDAQLEVKNAAVGTLVKLQRYEEISELFLHVENPTVGKRTRRLLKAAFGKDFATSGKWSAWWETEGRFRQGSHEERR